MGVLLVACVAIYYLCRWLSNISDGFKGLNTSERVEFEIVDDGGKRKAQNVVRLGNRDGAGPRPARPPADMHSAQQPGRPVGQWRRDFPEARGAHSLPPSYFACLVLQYELLSSCIAPLFNVWLSFGSFFLVVVQLWSYKRGASCPWKQLFLCGSIPCHPLHKPEFRHCSVQYFAAV